VDYAGDVFRLKRNQILNVWTYKLNLKQQAGHNRMARENIIYKFNGDLGQCSTEVN